MRVSVNLILFRTQDCFSSEKFMVSRIYEYCISIKVVVEYKDINSVSDIFNIKSMFSIGLF